MHDAVFSFLRTTNRSWTITEKGILTYRSNTHVSIVNIDANRFVMSIQWTGSHKTADHSPVNGHAYSFCISMSYKVMPTEAAGSSSNPTASENLTMCLNSHIQPPGSWAAHNIFPSTLDHGATPTFDRAESPAFGSLEQSLLHKSSRISKLQGADQQDAVVYLHTQDPALSISRHLASLEDHDMPKMYAI